MSKLQLKKHLTQLEKDELVALILEAYGARKETKEYFDFYLDPNVDKLQSKYEIAISKEFNRTKRGGYCKARISYVKKQIKEFQAFQPGFQAEIDLLFYTVRYALASEYHTYFSDTLIKGVSALMLQMVDIADLNLCVDQTLMHLRAALSNEEAGSRYFRRFLLDELDAHLSHVAHL